MFAVIVTLGAAFIGLRRAEALRVFYRTKIYCEDMCSGFSLFLNEIKNIPRDLKRLDDYDKRIEQVNKLLETENQV